MATSSEELAIQAEQLKDIVGFFKVDDNKKHTTKTPNFQEYKPKSKPVETAKVVKPKIQNNIESKGFDIKLSNNENLDNEFESFQFE